MLQFIIGKSGSGKTTRALNILANLRKSGNEKLLLLVPDQNSFESETALLNLLGAKLCRDVKVFGFSRLCDYVFKSTGNIPRNLLSDGTRSVLMSKALEQCRDRLTIYSSSKTRKSVLEVMLHSLKECKKDGITPEMLLKAGENVDSETLRNKLGETALVLETFDALLENSYIDPLDNLTRLKNILEENPLFDGYTVVADSFSGFTRAQLEVISVLLRQSKDFYLTLNLDFEQRFSDVFSTTFRTFKTLKRLAQSESVEIGENVLLENSLRSDLPEFSFLEKYILRVNEVVFPELTENIVTCAAGDVYREAEFVARNIKKLVVEEGFGYGDIAVVCRDISYCGGILDTALDRYDIPCFMSVPYDVFARPAARFLSCALDFLLNGYERESLLGMLKTGLCGVEFEDVCDFENYLFVWDIDGADLRKPFTENPSGFEKLSDKDKAQLEKLRTIQSRVIEPLETFKSACRNSSALEISKALYALMTEFDIEGEIRNLSEKLEGEGLIFEANDEVRVYNAVIDALDSLTAAVGDEKLTLKKYREYLGFMLADIRMSDIPKYQDSVNIGVADSIRLSNEKAVFIIGAADGEFPVVPKIAGAFSEAERKVLIENDIPLSDSVKKLSEHEKYLAYCALTAPSHKLFVSFANASLSGKSFLPSDIFRDIQRLFPNCASLCDFDIDEGEELLCDNQAFSYLAKNFLSNSPRVNALKLYFERKNSPEYDIEKIEGALEKRPFRIKNSQNAESLFGKNMNLSASQIEKFNLCHFRYFCNYGLRARERKKAEIDNIQFGNIVHYCVEKFLKAHNKETLNTLGDDDINRDINNIMAEFADENLGGLENKNDAFLVQFERLKINMFYLFRHLIRQLTASDFTPADFELKIAPDGDVPPLKVQLDDERSVSLNGFVDRVDLSRKNENEYYVRIVDYKTGKKTFSLHEILYGINMQMLVYLRAVTQGGKKHYGGSLIPAGILYMPASVPVIDSEEKHKAHQFEMKLRMNGLVLNDEDVLKRMDKSGDFIDISTKLIDDKYSDKVVSSSQFSLIFEKIDSTIREMGLSLLSGDVEAKPLKGVDDGCRYCPYGSVCLRKYGDSYRYGEKVSAKEVFEQLEKEAEK